MKKRRVTYAINGYMTYEAIFMVGKSKNKVSFTDGSMTATGKRPATFTTDSLMMQHIIENSPEYKKGFIYKYRSMMLNEEVVLEKNPPRCQVNPPCECNHNHHQHPAHSPHNNPGPSSQNPQTPEPQEPELQEPEAQEEPEVVESSSHSLPDPHEDFPLEQDIQVEQDPKKPQELTFKSNDDAKDYLEDNFGIAKNSIKTRPEIIKAAAAQGLKISFA